jgi:hypothetical protein
MASTTSAVGQSESRISSTCCSSSAGRTAITAASDCSVNTSPAREVGLSNRLVVLLVLSVDQHGQLDEQAPTTPTPRRHQPVTSWEATRRYAASLTRSKSKKGAVVLRPVGRRRQGMDGETSKRSERRRRVETNRNRRRQRLGLRPGRYRSQGAGDGSADGTAHDPANATQQGRVTERAANRKCPRICCGLTPTLKIILPVAIAQRNYNRVSRPATGNLKGCTGFWLHSPKPTNPYG